MRLHGCWVAEGFAKVAFDGILGREVHAFEHLGRDGNAAGGLHLLEAREAVAIPFGLDVCHSVGCFLSRGSDKVSY